MPPGAALPLSKPDPDGAPAALGGREPRFNHIYQSAFRRTLASSEDLAVMLVNCASLLLLLPVTVALQAVRVDTLHHLACAPAHAARRHLYLRNARSVALEHALRPALSVVLQPGLAGHRKTAGMASTYGHRRRTPSRETIVFLIPIWFWLAWREHRRIAAWAYSAAVWPPGWPGVA